MAWQDSCMFGCDHTATFIRFCQRALSEEGKQTMTEATSALTLQLLQWITDKPRTYAEVLDAWRTTCPRLSIWEDACIDGLIEFIPGGDRIVSISPKGRML